MGRLYRKIKTSIWKIVNPRLSSLILYEVPKIYYKKRFHFGKNVHINSAVFINAVGNVSIGDNTILSHGCCIISTALETKNWNTRINRAEEHIDKRIKIGNNVWLCANTTVLGGVNIADNCIIAAGSVVTKSINEPNTLWGGCPALKLKDL